MGRKDIDRTITIDDLYPDMSPEELRHAQEKWLQYLRVVRNIWNSYEREGRLHELIAMIKAHRKAKK